MTQVPCPGARFEPGPDTMRSPLFVLSSAQIWKSEPVKVPTPSLRTQTFAVEAWAREGSSRKRRSQRME